MTDPDLILRGGTVVTHDGSAEMDVAVRDGVVVATGPDLRLRAAREHDCTGRLVLPGLVDVHVHLREPGMTEKEDFGSGTRAAAAGGVTTIVDMPNTSPPVTTAARFAEKLELVRDKAHVDFGLYGMIDHDNADEIAGVAAQGAMGLKLFMGQTTGDNRCPDDAAIFRGLEAAAREGLVVGVHAENDHILRMLIDRLRASGRTDPRAHLESRPDFIETEAVTRIITLATEAGAQLHIHHLSSAAGLRRLVNLRAEGHRVTAEALVSHLLLDDSAYDTHGNLIKLNPPIRPAGDVAALWAGIDRGDLDMVATDHAPHTCAEQAETDVWRAYGGFIGVETMLPLMLTEAARGRLTVSDVVRLCSYTPARRWSMPGKGHIAPGFDADLVVVDPDREYPLDASGLHSKHNATPYAGWPLRGAVETTFLRGTIVHHDGEIVGPPSGRQVRPRPVPNRGTR
ncbi:MULTISPECIES: allantoinase AllB [Pseudonocardia]|uniref:Allantoinase n=2 Tax=Pseudonocardia TaxID=1847 RepID=A0A1Y2MTH2_PSEAH|nr:MULTISPECIES: allantoinase AllB [Pseudonocardia]OSY38504.1 Allantoinase [Pseudonocardia autotrophica]TDN77053.1 dihydroorotase [Pseudonocardia autotrophica]BBG01059.1 dihydroorotase [Pseudonocardia autotrophica]GEC26687.1 dihydroorotase [Pseudonocardia saturnea]